MPPLNNLPSTAQDGMHPNYSNLTTLGKNDVILDRQITKFTVADDSQGYRVYYDESSNIRIRCGQVKVSVPAATASAWGQVVIPQIKVRSVIPVIPLLTIQGSNNSVSAFIEKLYPPDISNIAGFTVRLGNQTVSGQPTFAPATTVTLHWAAICVDP